MFVNLHHKDLRAVASKLSKILTVFYYDLQMIRFRISWLPIAIETSSFYS